MEEMEQPQGLAESDSSDQGNGFPDVDKVVKSLDEPSNQEKPQSPVDLDSVEKFRLNGRDWDRKELLSGIMMQSDYTKKTQALAEERRYIEALNIDLKAVKDNPSLADEFKKTYPEKYHSYLEYVLEKSGVVKTQGLSAEKVASNIDPQLMTRIESLEKDIEERKVSAINAELDAKFQTLSKKYDMADEEMVLARAQSLLDKKGSLSDADWDSLWKQVHERNQKLADTYYSKKYGKQKEANGSARDVPQGGGIPSKGPAKAKSIKEVTDMLFTGSEGLQN